MKKTVLLFLLVCLPIWMQAQIITTSSSLAKDYQAIDIIFDAALSSGGLKDYQGDVFAHTGVIIEGSTQWSYAPAWCDNSPKYKLLPLGNNKWKLTISPSIRAYYGVAENQKILKMAFVFRSADGSKEGKYNGADMFVDVVNEVSTTPLPKGVKAGINYINDNTVTLALYAPGKKSVSVIGDFNNWIATSSHSLNRAGDYWWITLTNLEKGKEYAFQYLIDGSLRIADPYTDKILDPWNDSWIPQTVYPNLKPYPTGKTTGITSLFQTGQTPYNWQIKDFRTAPREKLVIYELHIRDFVNEHSYEATMKKMDYLQSLGVNAIELMPINEFEGNNSWGYNPSFYFAVDKYYGTKDAFKAFVDECHRRGMSVILDMVLNHSYGQSPFVQMYWDNTKNRPAMENPWYNLESPNTAYGWGSDFNHESPQTKALVDSICSFWMSEYKVDGYRFDFTKGFTNVGGDGWAYDQSRINILSRMASEIYKRKSDAIVILEHLADNSEEKVLANDANIMLWGNMNHTYCEAIMGYTDMNKTDLGWALHANRGFNKPNLVAYMESHDEERIMNKAILWGKDNSLSHSLKRAALSAAFYIPLPGPKMIWQFGELGYDYSINACNDGVTIEDGCRIAEKPIRWDYYDNTDRKELYTTYSKLIALKTKYPTFDSQNVTYSLQGGHKYFIWKHADMNAFIVGNFDTYGASVAVYGLPASGTWYDALTSQPTYIGGTSYNIYLNPGEFRIFIDKNIANSKSTTQIAEIAIEKKQIFVSNNALVYTGNESVKSMKIYDLKGRLLTSNQNSPTISLADISSNTVYVIEIEGQDQLIKDRFIKK